ncbi:hypothetical protein LMG24238_01122 [Paraburkholderia sediminicola]|uniref:Extensin n=1 Tax=Paraburkholderia sediminicola TaxID=458836 RepID=A0A6J5A2G0_9BURK|nr:hypothetical protein [Paraburkholderia sediminicola]CAB3650626.1 hypothetical protein LMG24238_01122 [Paraburkholderia sediminicola]
MMNTRKILMIVGGLLLVAAGISYLMLLQADRRSMAEVTAAMHESAHPAAADSRAGDQVTEGSIDQSKPSGAITKSTGITQEPVAPAPAVAVAPASNPAAAQVTVQPKQAPSTAVASVNVQDSGTPKVVPAQRAPRERDGLDHRATTTRGATPETDELVRESAKLDPSLPPPDMSAARAATDQNSSKPGKGSNPVAAAMTDQLVKESAKLDPSLPPPK